MAVQRRLAAILAADVAGYSRLMGEDEEGTRARFNTQLDEVVRPAIDQHRGRLIKTMGDGFLLEFGSVVDAVHCATDIQAGVAVRQNEERDDRKMLLRVGVHLGDVIVEGDDIHGDGVNIAARLEGIAEPGGICVSDMVRAGVGNKLALAFTDLGEQPLKNIAEPVHAFNVILADADDHGVAHSDALFRRPAVAVLPFENISNDPEQEYFADGLTEDIITALSLWRSFPVIARNSCFAYKGHSPDIRKVGKELGARYVIEGSVRKAGNRVRVTAQLINAEIGHHVWAERYDRELDDIFDLQDEITERIATTVAPELERMEHQRYGANRPSDLGAWDYYLRGMPYLHEFSQEGNRQARAMFERAVSLDPSYSRGHAGASYSHYRDALLGYSDDSERSIALCVETAQRAVSLDDHDAFAHFILSRGLHLAGKIEQGLHEARRAIELNPYDAHCYGSLGTLLISGGQLEEGIATLQRARQLSPKDLRAYLFLGIESGAPVVAGRYEVAATLAKDALNQRPADLAVRALLAASLGKAGRAEEARSVLADGKQIDLATLEPTWFLHWFKEEDRAQLVDGLRKAGWED